MPSDPHLAARNRLPVVALLGAVFVASIVLPWTPLHGTTICVFRLATGLPCPGCGLGRAFCDLSRGDLMASFHHHPLGLPIYLTLAAVLIHNLAEWGLKRRLPSPLPVAWRGGLAMLLGAAALAIWAVRLLTL